MAVHRSRALTGSRQPRPPVRGIRETIEHKCGKCGVSYTAHRTRGVLSTERFFVLQGHLEVMCPEGHRELIETSLRHLT